MPKILKKLAIKFATNHTVPTVKSTEVFRARVKSFMFVFAPLGFKSQAAQSSGVLSDAFSVLFS